MTSLLAAPALDRHTTTSLGSSAAIAASYADHGFVVVPDALTSQEVGALNDEGLRICRGDLGEIAGSEVNESDQLSDIEVLRRTLCIHYPHKLSALYHEALSAPAIVSTLTSVIGPNVKAMQSMMFVKSEGKPGQAWHQDEAFIPTRDRSLTGVWIALDDATIENGCLWVLPGSHARGVLYPAREQNDPAFDCTIESYDFPYQDSDAIPVEIPAGTALVFNGYLLHRSLQNSGTHGYRRALANHYMSAESLLPWRTDQPPGAHQAILDYRDIVLVVGTDPYAYKGISDLSRAHSRPDKDGGCDR